MAKKNALQAVGGYFAGVYREGKKVRWASADVVVKNTVVVLGYILFMAAVFYLMNLVIVKSFGILDIKM